MSVTAVQAAPRRSAAARLDATLRDHGPALGLIALVAMAVYGQAVWIRPFDADNVIALSLGNLGLGEITGASFVSYAPGYRPFAYTTLWAQYQLHGVVTWPYFAAQVAFWAGAAVALYALIRTLAGSRTAAALGAVAFLVDQRGQAALFWIGERQSSLAVLCGLVALVFALRLAPGPGRKRAGWAVVAVLLVLAALSKEYGLAFAAAVAPVGLAVRAGWWRPALVAAVLAVLVYGVMRVVLAGGAGGEYCESMGYFTEHRADLCYGALSTGERVSQHAYNSAASLVGTFQPHVFTESGVIQITSLDRLREVAGKEGFLFHTGVAVLALVGFLRLGRRSWPLLALIAANACLNLMLYRTRNQVIGIAAVYAASAVGGAWLLARLSASPARRLVARSAVAVAVVWVGWHAVLSGGQQVDYRLSTAGLDPCEGALAYPDDADRDVVAALKTRYGLPDPTCAEAQARLAPGG